MTSEELLDDDADLPNLLSAVDNRTVQELRLTKNLWKLNYHEASIFIEEGLNNDKFENHPKNRRTSSQIIVPPNYTDLVQDSPKSNSDCSPKTKSDKLEMRQQTKITFKDDNASINQTISAEQELNELMPLAPKITLSKPMIESVMTVEPLLSNVQRHKTNPFARHKVN